MNYLGHLLVLPDQGLVTLGNLLGDFVKGRTEGIQPLSFALGIRLHRELDRFTDLHPAVRSAKRTISSQRSRIAGILIDVFFDHFYALSLREQGHSFSTYRAALEPFIPALPQELQRLPVRMVSDHWFGSYSAVEGIGEVLSRMDLRRQRPLGLSGAESELLQNYEELRPLAFAFLPDAQAFTKEALLRLQSASPAVAPRA